jgi:hypothetical protein
MKWQLLAVSLMAGWCVTRPAGAHAPPQATGIRWSGAEGGERAIVRTNRGLIIADPGGGSFRIVCNEAFETSLAEVPPLTVAADGRILLGTYAAGLVLSSPDACNFDALAGRFAELYPIDVDSDQQGGFFAAVLPRDGGSAELLQSSNEGRTAESLATLPGAPSALAVAPSDGSRVYVSSTLAEENLSFGRLLTSHDAGRTFTETEVELDASELRVFLLAVDPNQPDRVFLRTQSRDGITPERLLRSDDGGVTFATALSVPGPLSAVVQPDGTVWLGGAEGLYRSRDGGQSFAPLEGTDLSRVTCLATNDERIYACGYSAGEFGVMVSADGGDSFEWFLRFPWVTARLDCPADSDEGMRCAIPFLDWKEEQLEPSSMTGEAGAPAGAAPSREGRRRRLRTPATHARSTRHVGADCRFRAHRSPPLPTPHPHPPLIHYIHGCQSAAYLQKLPLRRQASPHGTPRAAVAPLARVESLRDNREPGSRGDARRRKRIF